jgi:hypothetical protein
MKPYPRSGSSEGAGVALSSDLYNRMIEDIERLDKLSVTQPLTINRSGGGTSIGINLPAAPASDMTLVAIIGTETGGGRYKGSILTGNSTGNTSNNFQLQPSPTQSATDGPVFQTSGGHPVNNALVINVREQAVPGTHVLYSSVSIYYAVGRIMGQTSEATPRTIVYVDGWPLVPVIAKIAGVSLSSLGGIYYGKIAQGQFSSSSNSYASYMSNYADAQLPSVSDCWIINNWEQLNIPESGHNQLATGSYVAGLMTGFPVGALDGSGGSATEDTWYMVYTWTPPQAVATSIASVATTQTAGTSYGTNEQTMMNNLKTDVSNLRLELFSLYQNLKSAGYSL